MFKSRQCALKSTKIYKISSTHFQLTCPIHALTRTTKLRPGLTYAKHVNKYPD